jgi:hypothetical protein
MSRRSILVNIPLIDKLHNLFNFLLHCLHLFLQSFDAIMTLDGLLAQFKVASLARHSHTWAFFIEMFLDVLSSQHFSAALHAASDLNDRAFFVEMPIDEGLISHLGGGRGAVWHWASLDYNLIEILFQYFVDRLGLSMFDAQRACVFALFKPILYA